MVQKLIKLIFPMLMLILGIQFTRYHYTDSSELRKNELIELQNNGSKTEAFLDTIYKEQTIKILGLPVKHYVYNYSYSVDGNDFKSKFKSKEKFTQFVQEVTYLENNSSINSLNVDEELKYVEESEDSNALLVIGIILILLGIYGGYVSLNRSNNFSEQESE